MTGFLLLDQVIDHEIDFLPGHVALVLELIEPQGFNGHGGVHHADLGNVQQRDASFELIAHQVAPTVDDPPGFVGVVADGVRVMPGGHHGDIAGRPVEGAFVVAVQPQMAERGVALAILGTGGQFAGLGQIGNLVPMLDAPRIDRLPHLVGPHHVHIVVVPFGHLVLGVLGEHLPEHGAIAQGLAANPVTDILGGLALNFVDHAHAETDGAEGFRAVNDVEPVGKPTRNGANGYRLGRGLENFSS